jgi:hypothetical protein
LHDDDFELPLGKIALANESEEVSSSHKGKKTFCGHWIAISEDYYLFSFFGLLLLKLDGKRDSLKILRDLEEVAEWTSNLLV